MRSLILFFTLFFTNLLFSQQLTLDATYNGAAQGSNHFLFVQIDSADYKYVVMNPVNSQFTLYNLNHSIYLNVAIPTTFLNGSMTYTISYISKSLIDCDSSNVEYILSVMGDGVPNSYPKKVLIYRTDGNLLQTIDSCVFMNFSDGKKYGPEYNKPIINTPTGSKLILRHLNGDVKVFNLCSSLPQNIDEGNIDVESKSPFPNPTNNFITLPYSIPSNEKVGEVIIYNLSGQQVKSYLVDKNFSELKISLKELPSGTYYYILKTKNQVIKGEKILKVGN